MTQITGPLQQPLEILAKQLKTEKEVNYWTDLIHDYLMERITK